MVHISRDFSSSQPWILFFLGDHIKKQKGSAKSIYLYKAWHNLRFRNYLYGTTFSDWGLAWTATTMGSEIVWSILWHLLSCPALICIPQFKPMLRLCWICHSFATLKNLQCKNNLLLESGYFSWTCKQLTRPWKQWNAVCEEKLIQNS